MQSGLKSIGTGLAVSRDGFHGVFSLVVPVLIENYSHCSDSVICEMELRLTPLGSPWWSVIASWLWSRWVSSSHSSELQNRRPAALHVRVNPLGSLADDPVLAGGSRIDSLQWRRKRESQNSAPKGDHYLQIKRRQFMNYHPSYVRISLRFFCAHISGLKTKDR